MIRHCLRSLLLCCCLLLSGCLSYYARYRDYHEAFERGGFEEALQALKKSRVPRRNYLLHYMNLGTAAFMAQRYEDALQYFEVAYRLGNKLSRNYLAEGAAELINPMYAPYRGEYFELLMIHYYKALAYLKLARYEEAIVECRRVDILLRRWASYHKNQEKIRYKSDAFFYLIMGLAYDAVHDYNNAFIAYRNAWQTYRTIHSELFGVEAPGQLKKDILRTAYLSDLTEELHFFEKEFGLTYDPAELVPGEECGEVVFFWHTGLAPVKVDKSISFTTRVKGDEAYFYNDEYGWEFESHLSKDEKEKLSKLETFNVVIPEYKERPPYYQSAGLIAGSDTLKFELAEDVNAVALHTLKQRLFWEVSSAVLRMAIRKAIEKSIEEDNEDAAMWVGLFLQMTQQSDTRAWMTLPYAIHYARVRLPAGKQSVTLRVCSSEGECKSYDFTFEVEGGKTQFHYFHNLQSHPLNYY